jgi:hypothetical protein
MSTSGGAPATPGGWDPHIRPLHFRGVHVHHHLRGRTQGRLRGHLVLVTFIVGLSLAVGIGAVVVALAAPGTAPLCKPYTPCGPATSAMGLVNQTVWRSSQFGFTVEYPAGVLSASDHSGSGVVLDLQAGNAPGSIIVVGEPASQATPGRAITAELGKLSGISSLAADTSPADRLLGPAVGYRTGVGGVYTGYADASQGVGGAQTIYAESASDGRVVITVLAISAANDAGPKSAIAQAADLVINSIRWA